MDGVVLTPLKIISTDKGDILHVMKRSDDGYKGFGEAYFSTVKKLEIKGWRKHNKMTLNLVVPQGEIEFILFDGQVFFNVKLSKDNYQRLTVESGIWMAFRGVGDEDNLLLNLADIPHDPHEAESKALSEIDYEW